MKFMKKLHKQAYIWARLDARWPLVLLILGSSLGAALACVRVCSGCAACSTAGALASPSVFACHDYDYYYNQTTYSDSCLPAETGGTNCLSQQQQQWGTVTQKACSQVLSYCLCVTEDPNYMWSWDCTVDSPQGSCP